MRNCDLSVQLNLERLTKIEDILFVFEKIDEMN